MLNVQLFLSKKEIYSTYTAPWAASLPIRGSRGLFFLFGFIIAGLVIQDLYRKA